MSLPYVPASRRKHVEYAGVADREVLLVQDLGRVERGQRHLRRPDQVELVRVRDVDVDLVGREEPAAEHRLLADEHRRDHRDEPVRRQHVERVADQRELHVHDVAQQVDEPRAAGPRGRVRCRACRAAHPAPRGPWARSRTSGFAVPAHLDRVLVREPVRRGPVRARSGVRASTSVSSASDLLELRLELLELGRDRGHLGDRDAASRRPGRRRSPCPSGSAPRAAPPPDP